MAVEPVGIRIADDARAVLAAKDGPADIGLAVGCRRSVTGISTPAFAPEGGSPFRDAAGQHAPLAELPKQLLDGPLDEIPRRVGRFQPTAYGQAEDDEINDVARKAKEHPPQNTELPFIRISFGRGHGGPHEIAWVQYERIDQKEKFALRVLKPRPSALVCIMPDGDCQGARGIWMVRKKSLALGS